MKDDETSSEVIFVLKSPEAFDVKHPQSFRGQFYDISIQDGRCIPRGKFRNGLGDNASTTFPTQAKAQSLALDH